jgi:hypothetical protein
VNQSLGPVAVSMEFLVLASWAATQELEAETVSAAEEG